MKVEIESTLQPLIGEPLSDMWRYAGLQKFEFGVQRPYKNRKGQDITWADWGVVVACDWRMTGPDGVIVSSSDFGPDGERRDEDAFPFYEMLAHAPPIVETVEAQEDGSVCFAMTRGYLLEVLPDGTPGEEQWRFVPIDEKQSQFVVLGDGIET